MQKLTINSRVRLRSFNGTMQPVGKVSENENYWKLIGKSGTIVEDEIEMEKLEWVRSKKSNPVKDTPGNNVFKIYTFLSLSDVKEVTMGSFLTFAVR